ncbi:MAG TPA: DUF4331 family protein [Vicinamibacterales bacterium]|nr:DUF4331 family protein [Vicinamibacterales bacterium]
MLLLGYAIMPGGASSHREAPLISSDPQADNTDVYAFVSPDAPDTVTIIDATFPDDPEALAWHDAQLGEAGWRVDARVAIAQALRTGTKDQDIRAHASAIEAAAGQAAAR